MLLARAEQEDVMIRSKLPMAISLALVFVLVSAGAALAEPLSKQEWRQQATDICTASSGKVNKIASDAFGSLGANEKPTPAQLEAFVNKAVPVLEQTVDDVVGLEEPSAIRKNVKRWAAAVRKVTADLEDDPTILITQSDGFAKANKIAKKIGLHGCD
jgi:hypothetical protein